MKPKKKPYLDILGKKHPVRLHEKPIPYGKERRWGQISIEDGGTIDVFLGTPYMTLDTLIHEILHSVLDSLNHKALGNDEKFVGQLATAMAEVIVVNRMIFLEILNVKM